MQFEQNLVDECAAFIYWKYFVESKSSIDDFNMEIINSDSRCLTDKTSSYFIINEALTTLNSQIDVIYYPVLYKQINETIISNVMNGNKPFGRLHLEHLLNGKSSYIEKVNLGELNISPANLTETANIKEMGQLVLRTPLPSCVYSKTPPDAPIIKIQNTKNALNSDINMYMVVSATQEIDDGFVIYGDINIPTVNPQMAESWKNIIPNSFPSYSLFKAETPNEEYKIEFSWQ